MSIPRIPEAPVPFSLPLDFRRLQWQLDVLGWSHGELARRVDVRPNKAANWISGRSFMPNRIAIWLEQLALVMTALPGPLLWERDSRVGAEKHAASAEAFEKTYGGSLADADED